MKNGHTAAGSGPATLVADNPDRAGDLEADGAEIAQGPLSGRELERLPLPGTLNARSAIKAAFERGGSLMSYIGHGSRMLWASEQVLNTRDVDALASHSSRWCLAMSCLNAFFHLPTVDSLAEKLVKAEGKRAIAAFSSPGLSLD